MKYTYDALGRRMSKETSEYSVKYVYAMQDVVEEVKTDKKNGKTVKNEYIYGDDIDDVVAMYQEKESIFTRWEENEVGDDSTQESLYFVQKDIRGSTVLVSDEGGMIAQSFEYDEFGNVLVKVSNTDVNYGRLFTGREFEEEIGLYYYRARFYDPVKGTFLSRDPLGIVDSVNLYTYVNNDPVNFSDPMGQEKQLIIKVLHDVKDGADVLTITLMPLLFTPAAPYAGIGIATANTISFTISFGEAIENRDGKKFVNTVVSAVVAKYIGKYASNYLAGVNASFNFGANRYINLDNGKKFIKTIQGKQSIIIKAIIDQMTGNFIK